MTHISLALVALIVLFGCGHFKEAGIAADSTAAEARILAHYF